MMLMSSMNLKNWMSCLLKLNSMRNCQMQYQQHLRMLLRLVCSQCLNHWSRRKHQSQSRLQWQNHLQRLTKRKLRNWLKLRIDWNLMQSEYQQQNRKQLTLNSSLRNFRCCSNLIQRLFLNWKNFHLMLMLSFESSKQMKRLMCLRNQLRMTHQRMMMKMKNQLKMRNQLKLKLTNWMSLQLNSKNWNLLSLMTKSFQSLLRRNQCLKRWSLLHLKMLLRHLRQCLMSLLSSMGLMSNCQLLMYYSDSQWQFGSGHLLRWLQRQWWMDCR